MARRIVIAGTGSGVGKTTLTIGLMAALQQRGFIVQGFKCGPDYIDPTYHTAVTGRASRNLDSWMLGAEGVKEIYSRGAKGAHISIIEGVMGLFDGKNPLSDEGSAADISTIIDAPVLLVVDIQSMARSAAAIVKGFQSFSAEIEIAGVIVNKAGSEGHFHMVKEAVEQECGIPVLGYLLQDEQILMPERHLGLVPSIERGEMKPFFEKLGAMIEAQVDLDKLMELAEDKPLPSFVSNLFPMIKKAPKVKIAVAKDAAFHFYYPENLELLEANGAECSYFSPLAGEAVPEDSDGLYIGGGFPEEFAAELAGLEQVKASIKECIAKGIPTLAECGGFMYLCESIEDSEGKAYPMVGVIPGHVTMQKRLAAIGYREVNGVEGNFLLGSGAQAKGHEFHYSTFQPCEASILPYGFETIGRMGTKQEGFLHENVVAGYTHIHFGSNPEIVNNWIEACEQYKESKPKTT